jgi:hypothetical protein
METGGLIGEDRVVPLVTSSSRCFARSSAVVARRFASRTCHHMAPDHQQRP